MDNTNKEILAQLKRLNSAIEDYLDNLDMADLGDDDEDGEEEKKDGKRGHDKED